MIKKEEFKFRIYDALVENTTPLVEGVTPSGALFKKRDHENVILTIKIQPFYGDQGKRNAI